MCRAPSTWHSGNSPLRFIPSLATVRKKTDRARKNVLWRLCVRHWGDRVDDATEMLSEWKNAKRMGKDTIVPNRFNAGCDEGYKAWLKRDIQNISFHIPCSFRSVTHNEAKAVAELRELKEEAN